MVDLTDEENANWLARGREEVTDRELAELHGDVIYRSGHRFLVVEHGLTDGHSPDNPLPPRTEGRIFDAGKGELYGPQPVGTIPAHCPYFEPVDPNPDSDDDEAGGAD